MIYIIIPVFNRSNYTADCIRSILIQDYTEYEIIIVNDGSTDDTVQQVSQFSSVKILNTPGNYWWTQSINTGIDYIFEKFRPQQTDFILTLNNDLIVKPDYLRNLIWAYDKHKPCLVGSASVDIANPGYLHFYGVSWNSLTAKFKRRSAALQNSFELALKGTLEIDTDLLPGRGTLIPVKVFQVIGQYDNVRFPQYAADEDFSLRAKKAGFKLIVSLKATVFSYIFETGIYGEKRSYLKRIKETLTSRRSPMNMRTRFYWARKHATFFPVYFMAEFGRILVSVHRRKK